MFNHFFYTLREVGIPVSPTSFLTLQKALDMGLVNSLNDFYTVSRAVLVKSERYFDVFDQVFCHHFEGAELPDLEVLELDEITQALLDHWLSNPKELANALGVDESELKKLTPEQLLEYFKERLKEQRDRHEGGDKWIGTGGTSPVGHSGINTSGMRIGGRSRFKSAVKVAAERRFKDYSGYGPLNQSMIGEALKRLRNMVPFGPRDMVNIDETIRETMKKAGEIDIVFERSLRDRLKVILAIDNGGWSMDPYIPVVQTLFDYARSQFKDLRTFFFHNTIYDRLWEDPGRRLKPKTVEEFIRMDPETRLIIIGDASMAPFELNAVDGSIYVNERSGIPSINRLQVLSETFPHSAWLNPSPQSTWEFTPTVRIINSIFPMFELTLDGLEMAVIHLMGRH